MQGVMETRIEMQPSDRRGERISPKIGRFENVSDLRD